MPKFTWSCHQGKPWVFSNGDTSVEYERWIDVANAHSKALTRVRYLENLLLTTASILDGASKAARAAQPQEQTDG